MGSLVLITTLLVSLRGVQSDPGLPTCELDFEWMFNSKAQSPCLVSAYICGSCRAPASFTLDCGLPNISSPFEYINIDSPLRCDCSTVQYSLVGACAACQSASITTWTDWHSHCTNTYIEQLSDPIPPNTSVPAWAYLDVVSSNNFNVTVARGFVEGGDHPDSTALTPTPTPSSTTSSSQQPTPSSTLLSTSSAPPFSTSSASSVSNSPAVVTSISSAEASKVAPIVGGTVGGIAFIAIITCASIYWYLRRKKAAATAPPSLFQETLQPPTRELLGLGSGSKLYNPDDPSTYPLANDLSSINQASLATGSLSMPTSPRMGSFRGLAEL
ncbi:hypothetical protein BDW22DRAFT_1098553 [Trametopsis cervina]|nr:hypothetical protein BDW22DRAFT_1098553 [Trametopsis cervina]